MHKILCLILLSILIGCSNETEMASVKEEKTEEKETVKEEKNQEDLSDLELICKEEIEKYPGNSEFSIYVKQLNTEKEMSISSQKRQAASLIKLYIAGAVFENEEMILEQCPQEQLDLLLQNMICVSDNSAANQLVAYLGSGDTDQGKRVINEYCVKNNYINTHMGRLLLESNDGDDNYTSVKDGGSFLSKVYNNEMAGSKQILDLLCKQQYCTKIPAGIPDSVKVGNKTGELDTVENDVAIVFLENNPYILCIQSENLISPVQARNTIVEISKKVYEYMAED